MKKILNSGLALILLALASISAHAQNLLYISDSAGRLGTVNLTTDAVTILGTSGVILRDIAFTSNGTLYGNTTTGLYTVNTVNAKTTLVGSFGATGGGNMVGLVGNGSGLLSLSSTTTSIYAIDVAPFSITTLGGNLTSQTADDLTFGANGALYDILTNGNLDKITLNSGGTSFTAAVVGNTGNVGITGLATGANGTVYAVSGSQIYTVDLNTAKLTPFFNWAGTGLGTDTGAATQAGSLVVVPEPGNVALLLLGVAGLVLYQRRRSLANS